MNKEESEKKIEDLVLLGYPGISGSRFLWEKGNALPFSARYQKEERQRIEDLPRLFWKEKTLSFSAENIYLFTDKERNGEAIPLYEKDIRAKENAGEIKRGKIEDLFPGFASGFSLSEVLPLGKGGILAGLGEIGGGGLSFFALKGERTLQVLQEKRESKRAASGAFMKKKSGLGRMSTESLISINRKGTAWRRFSQKRK